MNSDVRKMGNCLDSCRRGSGSPEIRKDFEKDFQFLNQRRESLEKYLIELDNRKKIDCSQLSNQTIAEQAEYYVTQLLNQVEQQDARFKSTLLRSGSFYDQTKVGFPDEFDFMAKLELLSKPGLGQAVPTKLGFVRIVLEDQESSELWKEFLTEDTNDKGETIDVLEIMMLSEKFQELVDKAMKLVTLPNGWRRNPGSLRHGPCANLYFLIDGFQAKNPLQISIDLAPCITYPNYKSVQFPFCKYLEDKSSCTSFLEDMLAAESEILLVPFTFDGKEKTSASSWSYNYCDQMRVSFSLLEKAIFSQFASDSTEKRLFRVLKILRDVHLRHDGSMEDWEEPLPEGVYPDEPPSTCVKVTSVEPIVLASDQPETEQTSSELTEGETYIDKGDALRDLLQTYVFKSLFFYAKLHQDDWFSSGLSRAVLECLKALFDIYSDPHSDVPNFFFDGNTGETPNKRNREMIVRRLVKIVAYLKLQIALQ